jgi:hypothetical protein
VLRRLEPYHHFKFATIPWLYYLSDFPAEYSVFRKYLGYSPHFPIPSVNQQLQRNAGGRACVDHVWHQYVLATEMCAAWHV